ncbi:MAG: FecR domain-containing protein [Lachnospiraceae bacterium]|nr:FecR domain-containing protein [Lachnospiraceae bacterium]
MNILKSRKFLIIAGCSTAVLIAAIILVLVLRSKDAYRIVKIFEVDGTASVERVDTGSLDPYANMVLASGDRVCLDTGEMTLRADEDKYIYLEEQTELVLHATGNSEHSKTKIDLVRGAITNEIQNKLIGDSSYEINTPNSTMSVRGTIFYVRVYEVDGIKYTNVVVFDGNVSTRLVYKDGTMADKEVSVTKGSEVTIYEDSKHTDYVSDPAPIDFEALPESVLHVLQEMIHDGSDVSITEEEIIDILNGLDNGNYKADTANTGDDEDGISEDEGSDDSTGGDSSEGTDEGSDEDENGDGSDSTGGGDDNSTTGQTGDNGSGDNTSNQSTGDSQDGTGDNTGNGNTDNTDNGNTGDNNQTSDNSSTFTVTFMYNGSVFGTQKVGKGKKATEPSLDPAQSGSWDFDFDTAINADTTINWK